MAEQSSHGVRRWVIDGAAPERLVQPCSSFIPPASWPHWVRYDNDLERYKRTTRDLHRLHPAWSDLFAHLEGDLLHFIRDLCDDSLCADPSRHGAGLHVMDGGGHLSPHLDYSRHPKWPHLERRMNAVLFLTPHWEADWGGQLQFYGADGETVAWECLPAWNRAVIWESSELAYHGVAETHEGAAERVTAACYYLATARSTASRCRALYIPNRG